MPRHLLLRSGAQKGRWYEIAVDGKLTVNDFSLALRAAQDGIGITYVLDMSMRAAIDAGRWECALEPWLPPFEGLYLYYPSRFQVPPKLRVFIDFIREWSMHGTAKNSSIAKPPRA